VLEVVSTTIGAGAPLVVRVGTDFGRVGEDG